jgi:hypothetical protein
MGIEPTKPLLAQSFIGFEDRGRHQSDARFRGRYHTGCVERQGDNKVLRLHDERFASRVVPASK